MPGALPPAGVIAPVHPAERLLLAHTARATLAPMAGVAARSETRRLPPRKRFTGVTPAQNGRFVTGNLVDCGLAMDYPRRLCDVHVVADSCSDDAGVGIAYADLAGGKGAD